MDVERVRASEQAQRLFQVRKTVTEMLVARGYIVPQDEIDETLESFKAKFGENPTRGASQLRLHKKADSNEQILVFFPDKDKVGAQEIQECAFPPPARLAPCPRVAAASAARCAAVRRAVVAAGAGD